MAADDKINIFVKLDMNANKGVAFHISRNETVQELVKMIKDKEGPQVADVHLIRGAKPMRVKNNNGGLCKLSDYDCYNNCTIIASLRLLGGAQAPEEGVQFKSFDTKAVEKLGGTLRISGKADDGSIMYTNCEFNCSDGCTESGCPKASFGCSCVFCADCMRIQINNKLNAGSLQYRCAATSCTLTDARALLVYTIAAYTDDEKSAADVRLSENYFKRADSEMHVCANEKCKFIIHREKGSMTNKVQCTKCQKFTCWNCCREHKGDVWCGWDDCDPVAMINQLIELGSFKKINDKDCWDTRFCPNPACSAVNGHYDKCKHMKCALCDTQYCQLCLGLWEKPDGCSHSIACEAKPKQVINKSDLPK
jgi:hypothetical protein